MIALPMGLAVLAAAGGWWLSSAVVPPLRQTRTGRLATRVVELLVVVATIGLVLDLYALVRILDGFSNDPEAFAGQIAEATWSAGSLLGLAAIVHLLAPGFEEDDELAATGAPADLPD